jgi:hypothetical protein
MDYTVVLPFQYPNGQAPVVTEVRSTLIAASLRVVRQMGWEKRYLAALPAPLHQEIQLLTAGVWVPLSLALAHYRACDAMNLTLAELDTIGEDVSMRTQKAFIGTLGKAASNVGLDQWHFLKNTHRIWSRMMNGGDTCVYQVGPKEALVVLVACPLAELAYFRTGIQAYFRAIARVLSPVVYTREVREHRKNAGLGFRLSWV